MYKQSFKIFNFISTWNTGHISHLFDFSTILATMSKTDLRTLQFCFATHYTSTIKMWDITLAHIIYIWLKLMFKNEKVKNTILWTVLLSNEYQEAWCRNNSSHGHNRHRPRVRHYMTLNILVTGKLINYIWIMMFWVALCISLF